MGLTFAVFVFFGLLLVWVLLPFLPGLNEVRRKTDAKPLPIDHDSEVDIRHPARRFRAFVKNPLATTLDRCRLEGRDESGALEDGTGFLVLAKAGDLHGVSGAQSREGCRQVVFSTRSLELPPQANFPLELYGEDSVEAGSDSVFRAILAEESIRLGERCTTLRWIHAGGSIRTAPGCRLMGRASADGAMRLASGCRFERLHAPRIEFGSPVPPEAPFAEGKALQPYQVLNVAEAKAGRWLIKGALYVGARKVVTADLVATGRVEIGEGTRIEGSIKSHKDMVLSRGAVVTGSVVSGRSITLGEGCRIHGPIIAEETVTIAASCLLGSPDSQTTVSAKKIFVAPGVVCHGSVWAHEEGVLSGLDRSTPFIEVPRPSAVTQAEPEPQAVDQMDASVAGPAQERPLESPLADPMQGGLPESSPDSFVGAQEAAVLALEPEAEPEVVLDVEPAAAGEPPISIRRQALPRGTTLPGEPVVIGPVSFTSARERTADPSNPPRPRDSGSALRDPRALPVPEPNPVGAEWLIIVPHKNGGNGAGSAGSTTTAAKAAGAAAASGPMRVSPRTALPEDRDEG